MEMFDKFQYVEQLKQGWKPLLLSFWNYKNFLISFFLKNSLITFLSQKEQIQEGVLGVWIGFARVFWSAITRVLFESATRKISILKLSTFCGCGGRTRFFFVTKLFLNSVLRISPVAVPYIFGGGHSRLENIDRGHSLGSLLPPPAALPSLPQRATLVGLITRRAQRQNLPRKNSPSRKQLWKSIASISNESMSE